MVKDKESKVKHKSHCTRISQNC